MIEFYPNSIYYPREAVEEKLAKGELARTEKHLMGWTERHRGEIWDCARDDSDNPSDEILLDNLRALLLCKGSLQPAAEMGDMIKDVKIVIGRQALSFYDEKQGTWTAEPGTFTALSTKATNSFLII